LGLSAWAQDISSFEFYTFEIPQYVQSEEDGEFIRLANLIFKEESDIDYILLPPGRAYQKFNKAQHAVLFPYLNFGLKKTPYISDPFYYKKDYLFYVGEKKKPLAASRLCITQGYPYDTEYIKQKQFEVTETISDEACLKMLAKQRVDYFLCEALSGAKAIINTKVENINVLKDPVSSIPVSFAISRSKQGKEIRDHINKQLNLLRRTKSLKRIFNKAKQNLNKVLKLNYDPTSP
jgi:hypothetical protein